MKYITRPVWILSVVSLLSDIASEMLYPIMPLYLKSIGFSVLLIGILEGVAEATAGLSKGYFGKLSDHSGKRVPFVQAGYALSSLAKPMMALFANPFWIFLTRTVDRFGKGIRTGARDAILSQEATMENKARIFGFHRSMDTLGAVIGPVLALVYLTFYPNDYKTLFFIAFLPGLFAIGTTFLLKDRNAVGKRKVSPTPFFSFLYYWKESPAEYRRVVSGFLAFALFNSADVFLLLKAKQSGFDDSQIIGVYIFYNLVYALFSFPVGILADRVGVKKTFIFGLSLFVIVYLGMSLHFNMYIFVGLFFLYGLYAAATEGISKAWIAIVTDPKDVATAIGTYSGLQSIATMIASSLTGLLWYLYGAEIAFISIAVATFFVIAYFIFQTQPNRIAG